jgi:hypothetical protein
MSTRRAIATVLCGLVAAGALAACGDDRSTTDPSKTTATGTTPSEVTDGGQAGRLPCGNESVKLNPADFTTRIDNPHFPIRPGTRWSYRGVDNEGTRSTSTVTVHTRTKEIAGITATALRDRNTEDGELVEDALEWYAQDRAGNVWYLGEEVKEYEGGKLTGRGSSVVRAGGAQPGIAVPANPTAGMCFRRSYEAGENEDRLTVLSVREQVEVPFRHFPTVLMIKQTTPLEPKALEYSYHARGVGLVLTLAVSGGTDRVELVGHSPGK